MWRRLVLLLSLVSLLGVGSPISEAYVLKPPTIEADWGMPAIDGVLENVEWTLHPFLLILKHISGSPEYIEQPENLSMQVGLMTNAGNISVAVRIENITVISSGYIHRLRIAIDNNECQRTDDRGLVILQEIDLDVGNDTGQYIFHRSTTNHSLWNLGWFTSLAPSIKTEFDIEGQSSYFGNYSYEICSNYHLESGDTVYALTRTPTFRMQIIFEIIFRHDPLYVWTYCWPPNSSYLYMNHNNFDPVLFKEWCLVETQWTEPPPPPTFPVELVLITIGVIILVIVVWWVVRWARWRKRQHQLAQKHWRTRTKTIRKDG